MKEEDRRRVSSIIEQHAEKMPVEQLVARGNRHVRVISGQKTMELLEAVVDETIRRMAGADRDRIVQEAEDQFRRVARIQAEAEALIEQQKAHIQRQAKEIQLRVEHEKELASALRRREARLARARQTILSYDAEIERLTKEVHGRDLVETLLTKLGERDAKTEDRIRQGLDDTLDKVRKALSASVARPVDTPVAATDALVSKVFEEDMDSNLGHLDVQVSTLEGIADSLDRLRKLRGQMPSDGDEAPEEQRT
jgi:hypothetical protein